MNRAVLLVGLMSLAMVATSCGGGTKTVHGVVIEIDGQLDDIEGFEIVTLDGRRLSLDVTPGSEFHDLPLSHLNEHRVSGAPVIVEYEERKGVLVVLDLRDG